MARPSVTDDGRIVTLDLHGTSVADAVRIIRHVIALAGGRGRQTLRVVHGSSTSQGPDGAHTIRQALYDLLERGELRPWVVGDFRSEDVAVLSLGMAAGGSSTRLTNADLYAALR